VHAGAAAFECVALLPPVPVLVLDAAPGTLVATPELTDRPVVLVSVALAPATALASVSHLAHVRTSSAAPNTPSTDVHVSLGTLAAQPCQLDDAASRKARFDEKYESCVLSREAKSEDREAGTDCTTWQAAVVETVL
jgi:hypothetical protein